MTHNTPKILAVGLNPACQRTLIVDDLRLGKVNRATREIMSAGGKAIHFALAANTLAPGSTTPAFFSGGATGEFICRTLSDSGHDFITLDLSDDTRTCTTVLDITSGSATELISPSAQIPPEAVTTMGRRLTEAVTGVDALAFCGTYPQGVTEDVLLDIAKANAGKPLIVDAYRGVEQLLQSGLISVLKINLDEIRALTDETEPRRACQLAYHTFKLQGLLVTDGANPAMVIDDTGEWRVSIPSIDVVNPIGSGDTCAGVTTVELLRGRPLVESFANGLAAASASCLVYEGGKFDPEVMTTLRGQMTITPW